MQCPHCGMKMEKAGECPHCGAKILKHPAGRRYSKREPRQGLPLVATIIILIALLGAAAIFFLKSDTYLSIKAKRHFENGEYAKSVEILYGLMRESGPNEDLLSLAGDALRALGEKRMDEEEYLLAIPLFDEIIKINEGSMGTGGSDVSILFAKYNKAICYLKLAQDEWNFVDTYGEYTLSTEETIKEAIELAKTLDLEEIPEIKADLHILSAVIASERAASFWHENNIPQALVYFQIAEKEFNYAIECRANPEEYESLQEELDKLRQRLYK